MKIAIMADLHFRGKDLEAAAEQFQAVINRCTTSRVDAISLGGDLFDASMIGDSQGTTGAVLASFIEVLDWAREIPILAIDGNHDLPTCGVSALASLDHRSTFNYLPLGWNEFKGFAVFAFPWVWRGDAEEAVLAAFEVPAWAEKLPKLFLGHVQVGGAVLGGGRTCPEGPGTWRLSRATVEKLGQTFDRVALGDFHGRQPDLAGIGKGGYVGALRQLNHGEEGNPAGFEIWDTETGAVEWIELNAAPRYRTVEVREGEEIPKAAPNEILRVKTIDWKPSRLVAAEIEAAGVTIMPMIEKAERVARGDELTTGALNDPFELLAVWCSDKGHEGGVFDRLADHMRNLDQGEAA